jgi:hypothetical protein
MSNRIQAILSYRSAQPEPLSVHWTPDVPHFLEVFEPLQGVTFEPDPRNGDHQDYGIATNAPEDWRKGYAELRPIPPILERVAAFQSTLGTYIAIHVRRTDMTPLAIRIGCPPPSDEDYLTWCTERHGPVWVATDNGETQRKYQQHLGDRFRSGCVLGGYEVHTEHDHTIHGNMVDSIVDMWMCVGAAECFTQRFGTFSGTIAILRGLR